MISLNRSMTSMSTVPEDVAAIGSSAIAPHSIPVFSTLFAFSDIVSRFISLPAATVSMAVVGSPARI